MPLGVPQPTVYATRPRPRCLTARSLPAPSQHWESLCTLVQGGFDEEGDSPIQSTEPEQVESTGAELSPLTLASSAAVVGAAVALATLVA